jgi:hypothetical protein
MAIPVKFQQFKSAGIYRIVYDKSTVLGTEAELLRLVVGYSPKGPFNTPVYIKSVSDFKAIFGDISKSLENRGCYFHRTCIQALEAGPILCLNLKKFANETVGSLRISSSFVNDEVPVKTIYDTTRFWKLEPDNLNTGDNYLTITAIDSKETSGSVFVRKAPASAVKEYNISVADWYKAYNEDMPDFLVGYEDKLISDFFAEVFVFNSQFNKEQIIASPVLQKYFTSKYYTMFNGTDNTDGATTVKLVPTAKMVEGVITEGEEATYVTNSVYTGAGDAEFGIPERIPVVPTSFTLDGDAYGVSANKITYVELNQKYYLTSTLTVGENGNLVAEIGKAKEAFFQLGIGADNYTYAANQVIRIGKEFFLRDSIIYVDTDPYGDAKTAFELEPGAIKYMLNPSIKANPGDPVFGDTNYEGQIIVVPTVKNAFGNEVDALTALYNESTSGAVGHYIGCLLPNFIDNNSGYKSLDILFNLDSDIHHMMMSLNDTLLSYDGAIGSTVLDNAALKNEVENRKPYYLTGYTYANAKPNGTTLTAKVEWQNSIINVLKEETGLRNALLSAAEIEYRYIVDSFETFYQYNTEIKSELSLLAKEKELCFAILNFPSVSSLCKVKNGSEYPFMSGGVFDVNRVVGNVKGTAGVSLPSEANGASFCAFYTPLKFSDGYVDTIVPSAGLVSNLFIGKYNGRAPYSIIAGPNYSNIQYSQLVGPDYHYSQEELHVIEPFGVNCMIYRPTFGTFINANQTAKQTPKSALSAINVRELVIFLQDEIGKILQAYQWEFNNPTTRDAIKAKADLVCETAKRDGGIQQYLNVMDESNNDADIIDNEMCVLSTSIEPGRGAGKMVHELTIYRTGGMSSLIKEE